MTDDKYGKADLLVEKEGVEADKTK